MSSYQTFQDSSLTSSATKSIVVLAAGYGTKTGSESCTLSYLLTDSTGNIYSSTSSPIKIDSTGAVYIT
jgi:hypothetical protein